MLTASLLVDLVAITQFVVAARVRMVQAVTATLIGLYWPVLACIGKWVKTLAKRLLKSSVAMWWRPTWFRPSRSCMGSGSYRHRCIGRPSGRCAVVIQTQYGFRLRCSQSMFLRVGKVCEDYRSKLPWRDCYRRSKVQSTVLASMVTLHLALDTWQNKVTTSYIALNDFCRNRVIECGWYL